jgi:ribonuclease VapC
MIVDTSALLAVFFEEPEAERFARAIAGADVARISAANLLEAGIVADNQTDPRTGRQLDALVVNFRLRIDPVTEEQVWIARQAYVDYGRGNHPAGLNFGDCLAYALAKATGEPLLFKGEDFARTDIRPYRSAASDPWSRDPA